MRCSCWGLGFKHNDARLFVPDVSRSDLLADPVHDCLAVGLHNRGESDPVAMSRRKCPNQYVRKAGLQSGMEVEFRLLNRECEPTVVTSALTPTSALHGPELSDHGEHLTEAKTNVGEVVAT